MLFHDIKKRFQLFFFLKKAIGIYSSISLWLPCWPVLIKELSELAKGFLSSK